MLASNNKSVKQGKKINHINSLAPTSHNIGNHLIMSSSAGRLMHCKFCILASCTLQHLKTENLDLGHCQELKNFRQSTMAPLLVENSDNLFFSSRGGGAGHHCYFSTTTSIATTTNLIQSTTRTNFYF